MSISVDSEDLLRLAYAAYLEIFDYPSIINVSIISTVATIIYSRKNQEIPPDDIMELAFLLIPEVIDMLRKYLTPKEISNIEAEYERKKGTIPSFIRTYYDSIVYLNLNGKKREETCRLC